jgi:hypothetical protein
MKMKNIFKNILVLTAALLCLGLAGCQKTNTTTPVLSAFGPCPVLRGSTITFVGENLDKVTSVTFPDGVEITELTKEGSNKMTATVPQNAVVGKVILKYAGGTITSVSNISYTEPYSISSISPTDKSIRQGDVVTIDGDYLNNIVKVVFMSAAEVAQADFISQSRKEITLALPKNAMSGKLKVVDASENELYSDNELTVLQPAISLKDQTIKAGVLLTIPGTNMDLVSSVKFQGGTSVEAADFATVSTTAIVVQVPANCQDGAITATSYAGIEATSTGKLTMLLPTVSGMTSASNFKAGNDVVISGTDLDLVTNVAFSSGKTAIFSYSSNKITAAIPTEAVDGPVTLTCASAKTVETDAITLLKPTITSIDPSSVVAGNDFTVKGTDLDLVTTVKLKDEKLKFDLVDDQTLTVHSTATSATGKVTAIAANGDAVEFPDDLTVTYEAYIIISSMPSTAGVDDEITVTGSNFNMIDAVYFGDKRVTSYVSRTNTEMVFRIPDIDSGVYNMRFLLFSGDSETCAVAISITGKVVITELWSGTLELGTGWGVSTQVSADKFANIHPGDNVTVEFTEDLNQGWWQAKLMDGNWTALTSPTVNAWGCIDFTRDATSYTFAINYADVAALQSTGMVISGYAATITRLYASSTTWKREAIGPDAIMIQDYEPHGGHNADWDAGWNGGTQIDTDADGNHYLTLNANLAAGSWFINCNHQSNGALAPTLNSFTGYVVKIDIKLANDIAYPDGAMLQFVYGDKWYWIGNQFFTNTNGGLTTHGSWITLTMDPAALGWTCQGDGTSGTNGMFYDGSSTGSLPAGISFDNLRFEPK